MALIREEGKINKHTYLIDAVHDGISRGYAVYLIKGGDGETCLIDAGTKNSARVIYEKLKSLEVKTISLAHFGCLSGKDTQSFLDDSVSTYSKWMEILSKNSGSLDNVPFLVERFWTELYHYIPEEYRPLIQPGLTEAVTMAAGTYATQHT